MSPHTPHLTNAEELIALVHRFPEAEHAQATQRVVDIATTAISDGILQPGEQLSEVRISEVLNVSRNTFRQASMVLASRHLIDLVPNRGAFVKVPTQEEVFDIFTLRRAIESTALVLIEPGEQPELRQHVENAKEARDERNAPKLAAENHLFHRGLVALAQSPRLNEQMETILAEMRLIFFTMSGEPDFHSSFVDDNGHLLDLVEAGETDEAVHFLDDYIRRSQAFFVSRF